MDSKFKTGKRGFDEFKASLISLLGMKDKLYHQDFQKKGYVF